ncbi:unnamed protein product [Orchesella dallaii]|uniref:Uncharacterized protein n=2 Tax=Orchesella dallaii TaxID=48710 RepID=A0ABP1S368_9HEXA
MLLKWDGNPQGFLVTTAAVLVNIFAVVVSGIPSSVPTPMLSSSPTAPDSEMTTGRRVPKQVGLSVGATVASNTDHQSAGTHHHHGHHGFVGEHHGMGHGHHHHHGDGKYFQYAHNPGYDEYEYGYRRGNDYHFQERYEKYGPYWNFKTKVKWGDKYAGYGEHYWDYNHAGSGHDDGGHGHGHHSEPVPTYENQPNSSNNKHKVAMIHKRQSDNKKNGNGEAVGPKRIAAPRPELADSKPAEAREMPMLVLDSKTGQIIDTVTGNSYWLKPTAQPY